MRQPLVKSKNRYLQRLHPWQIRVMHWINALAMFVMIGSGWKIYQDEVLFGWLHFPDSITIGGSPEGALKWYFLGMWVLAITSSMGWRWGAFGASYCRSTPMNSSPISGTRSSCA